MKRVRERNVQVKLMLRQSEKDQLEAEAKAAGRPLATEITRRLRGGQPSPAAYLSGWPAPEADAARKLGEAVARLSLDVTAAVGSKTPLARRLGFMRAAMSVLLDELGAETPDEEQAAYFSGRTRDAITDAMRKHIAATSLDIKYVESDLARIVRELRRDGEEK